MTLESQKMIVGDQKPPSIIFLQGRLGEFFFFFRYVEQLIFVCLGFFSMQIIYLLYTYWEIFTKNLRRKFSYAN